MSLNYTIEVLRKLVSIPTVNPPGKNYRGMAFFLKNELENMGFNIELIEIPEEYLDKHYPYAPKHKGHPRFIVYARYGEGEPVLHFNCHYDVVPPGEGWRSDPFTLRIEDDKVFGRGTTDMKGGIAALLTALKNTVESGKLKHPIEAVFVPDEESGGIGTKYLVEELGFKPKYTIIPEPTTSERLAIGHKGMIRGLVKVIGKQCHASRPWHGINAFEKACIIVSSALPEIREEFGKTRSKYPFIDEGAAYTTLSLGGYAISPVMKDNVVPGEFVFSFDLRVIPEIDNLKAYMYFENTFRKHAEKQGVKIEIEKLIDIPTAITPPDSPLVEYVKSIATRIIGFEPIVFVNTGRYDLIYYRSKGSHVVVYGPGVRGQAHTINEYTTLSELEKFAKIYTAIIENTHILAKPN